MRRDPRPAAGEAGITLVELVITVALSGVLLPLVIGVLVSAQRSTHGTLRTADAVAEAGVGLQDVDRQVRSAAGPVHVDGAAAFGVWTNFAPDGTRAAAPRCLQYRVDGTSLRTRTFPASAGAARPAWSTARAVASGLTSGSAFAADGGTSSVSVQLVVERSSGRPATVGSVLTPRNATTADTSTCGVLA